jgi:hypothetical protein
VTAEDAAHCDFTSAEGRPYNAFNHTIYERDRCMLQKRSSTKPISPSYITAT